MAKPDIVRAEEATQALFVRVPRTEQYQALLVSTHPMLAWNDDGGCRSTTRWFVAFANVEQAERAYDVFDRWFRDQDLFQQHYVDLASVAHRLAHSLGAPTPRSPKARMVAPASAPRRARAPSPPPHRPRHQQGAGDAPGSRSSRRISREDGAKGTQARSPRAERKRKPADPVRLPEPPKRMRRASAESKAGHKLGDWVLYKIGTEWWPAFVQDHNKVKFDLPKAPPNSVLLQFPNDNRVQWARSVGDSVVPLTFEAVCEFLNDRERVTKAPKGLALAYQHVSDNFEAPVVEDAEEFEVEAIVGDAVVSDGKMYKVRWKGYSASDDSWVNAAELDCPELIRKYNAQGSEQTSRRQSRRGRSSRGGGGEGEGEGEGDEESQVAALIGGRRDE